MKKLLTLLAIVSMISLQAQTGKQSKAIQFCFQQINLPASCQIESEYQIRDDQADLSWIYVADDNMLFASNGLMKKLETYPEFKKEKIMCYLLNHKVTAYKVSFASGKERLYKIIAFGKINNQPVLVQLGMKRDPARNADIPLFAREFIQF